jgi:hypothetical protein
VEWARGLNQGARWKAADSIMLHSQGAAGHSGHVLGGQHDGASPTCSDMLYRVG